MKTQKSLSQHLSEWSAGKLRGILRSIVQPIAEAARGIDMPSMRELEERLQQQQRRTPAEAGPKRQMLFSISTPGPVPAAVEGVNGTAVASGAPQKPFQPHRMIVAGTQIATSYPGGTQGLLITALFIGSDLQLVNVPGSQSGIPLDFFAATAFDAKFRFDAAYPAIGITLNVSNPTNHAATLFNVTFIGDEIS